MAKAKRKGLADKVRNKKKNRSKPAPNPFEVKINKVKHTVVNKKVQKWEKGTPGLSRSKAVKQRKDTLLRELHHMKKSNSLHDKRIGELDSNLTADERMVQRFAMEKKKQGQKGDFSLNEEEETLTHYGQSLAENLQDAIGSDEEEEEREQMRTGDLQFGGFAKSEEVSWKDKMKEVIADSKKQKYERQMEKEKALESTNELNNQWKTVICSLKPLQKHRPGKKISSYVQLFRNLVLEQKSAGGSDKLKTEEERAQEEAERLQRLEAERISRMKGDEEKPTPTHVSADDLTSCFALDDPPQKARAESEDSDSENEEENELPDSADEDKEEGVVEEGAGEKSGEEGEDESDEDSEESDDNYSDLASDEEDENSDESGEEAQEEPSTNKVQRKETKVGKKELPFVFTAPGSFEELESLLHGHDGEEQAIILSRLRKCHHPSLAEGNKEKLKSIHLYVLQYFGKLACQQPLDKKLLGYVSTGLWETLQTFKSVTASALQKYLTQRQEEFTTVAQKRKGRGLFPHTELLLHLALIENFFPTSDFRHPVCTPALNFIAQILAECPVKDGRDMFVGLFLCSLALKYVSQSKRYVPEVITFLHGVLMAAVETDDKQKYQTFPPFRTASKAANLLVLDKNSAKVTLPGTWSICDMDAKEKEYFESDQFKCEALHTSINLLLESLALWSELPCLGHVTQPLLAPLSALDLNKYPTELQLQIKLVKGQVQESSSAKFKMMQQPSKKPEPLKLFEPKIEEFWSGKRKKGGSNRQANERQRLTHKYKREMKAAIREIKRDNEVLAKHQLEVTMQKDKDRKRKMKDLMNSLASQEGDYKAIKRGKK